MTEMPSLESIVAMYPRHDHSRIVEGAIADACWHLAGGSTVPSEIIIDLAFAADCPSFDVSLRDAAKEALSLISKESNV